FEGGTPATSNQQNPQVFYETPGTYDVTLTVTNSAGQDMMALVDYITVESLPMADFSNTVNGATVDFTNLSVHADSYQWFFGDSNSSTATSPTHTYASDGTYTVMLLAENNCDTDTLIGEVVIVTPPLGGFSADVTSGCADLAVQFTDESTDNVTGWSWTFAGGDPATSSDSNPLVTYTQAGTYTVTLEVTNAAGNNTVTEVGYIVVDDVPTAGFTESINGNMVDFTNTSTNATSYSWDFGDTTTSTETDPSHSYAMDGTYTVTLTASNACGDVVLTQEVVILTPPTAGFSADVTSGCADLVVQFSNESTENATSWLWTFSGGNPATSTDQNPVVTYTQAGTYTVTLEASNGAGSDAVTQTNYIVVDDVPVPGFTSVSNSDMVDFTNTSTNATTYSWDFGDNSTSTEVNPTHTYAMDGTYTVTLEATNACGTATLTNTVVVSTLPIPGFTSDVVVGCADLVVQFTDASSENTTGWFWVFEGGDPATSTDQNPVVTYATPGIYDVGLQVSNAAGSAQVVQNGYVTVLGLPTAGFQSMVNGSDAAFMNTSTGGDTYSWDFGDTGTSSDENPNHTYAMDGTYTVTLEVTNECGTVTITDEVVILTPPTAGFTTDVTSGCADLVVQFTDASTENATDWLWTFEGGTPASSTDQNPVVTYSQAGVYAVTLEVSNAAGSNSVVEVDYIVVDDVPEAGFTSLVNGAQVDFSNTSVNAVSYSWDFGDSNTSSDENPSHSYAEDGVYTVTLTATNACGSVTVTEVVTIITPPVAGFGADATGGCADLVVQFSDASTTNATDWLWTFEGGDPMTSTDPNPVVTYSTAGVYSVTLEVRNAAGVSTVTESDYIVVDDVPEAAFSTMVNGAQVGFSNTSTNATAYLWDFGDNSTS
ncbi:MAG: PKD domain-containing protein, partial [Phaeodactylibacter sp.]|nr:PKD domain-containing protein [Phaeodactylibacter sp.]